MDHDPNLGDPLELASLYLAGAMPPDEHRAFEAHLATGCRECADQVRHLAVAMEALASAIAPIEPDPSTRERLLRRLSADPRPAATDPARAPSKSPRERARPTYRRAVRAKWRSTLIEGIEIRVLRVDPAHDRLTAMVRMAPGAAIPPHDHPGTEEIFLLEGDFRVADDVFLAGDYLHYPPGSSHDQATSDRGCVAIIIMPMDATGGILERGGVRE